MHKTYKSVGLSVVSKKCSWTCRHLAALLAADCRPYQLQRAWFSVKREVLWHHSIGHSVYEYYLQASNIQPTDGIRSTHDPWPRPDPTRPGARGLSHGDPTTLAMYKQACKKRFLNVYLFWSRFLRFLTFFFIFQTFFIFKKCSHSSERQAD